MRLIRFRLGERIATGVLDEEDVVHPLVGTFFERPVPTDEEIPVAEVRLLAPVIPSKVIAVGKNYPEHAAEFGGEVPEEPLIFMKPSTSVIGPGDQIPIPDWAGRIDYEGELGLVVGRLCRQVAPEDAMKFVLGSTCGNDVTARELQAKDGQWTRAKGFDGFCPLGPWIETEVEASDLELTTRLNDEVVQKARTSDMAFSPAGLVAHVSRVMTLLPGDVILTGTPAGIGSLSNGDRVEVQIEGIGTLANEALLA
ncbi:MAG: fumarylacetoacetate hydrolase family protein [Actinomycetota bacterium]